MKMRGFEGQTLIYLTFWLIFGAQGIIILTGFNSRTQIKKYPYTYWAI
jgi:hypothetical protein